MNYVVLRNSNFLLIRGMLTALPVLIIALKNVILIYVISHKIIINILVSKYIIFIAQVYDDASVIASKSTK